MANMEIIDRGRIRGIGTKPVDFSPDTFFPIVRFPNAIARVPNGKLRALRGF